MNTLQHYFTRTLLSICTLLCIMPAMVQAQLFGGMIKSKNGPPVIPGVIPATITLATNQRYFVASVYDTDYLPYTAPTGPASTAAQAANGVAEAVTANVQGAITTTGVTVMIAATTTGSGTLPAYSTTATIPAAMTQDGIARDLTLSWAAQSYTSSTTSIAATLKAVGGTLNAIKLDINAGIGNDYSGVLLGQLVYPYNATGTTTNYSVRDIPGIPDKMFGQSDNGGVVRHNFLYFPVKGEDGKVWLNNNLGADYANANSSSFNPTLQATAYNDYHAYGSLFQWGRKPDGHELISWTATGTGTPVNTTVSNTISNAPAEPSFILNNASPYDWRATQDNMLWFTEAGTNNPCPSGYRLPSYDELNSLCVYAGITNYTSAASSTLHFTVPGFRYSAWGAGISNAGSDGDYWTYNVNGSNANFLNINSGGRYGGVLERTTGFSVRCVQN